MSRLPWSADALMMKAETALSSARALLDIGDVDGAVNRAYYAMFDAARAALVGAGAPVQPDAVRTHSGLIGAFGRYLVKNGPMPKEIGRLLNRVHEIRLLADYDGDTVDQAEALELVKQATNFVAAVRIVLVPPSSIDDPRIGCDDK